MKESVWNFSCAACFAVIIYFFGFMCLTIIRSARKEIVSPVFTTGALVSCVCAIMLSVSEIFCAEEISGEIIPDIVFASVPIYAMLLLGGSRKVSIYVYLTVLFISLATFTARMVCRSAFNMTGSVVSLSPIVIIMVLAVTVSCICGRLRDMNGWCRKTNLVSDVEDKVNTMYLLILLVVQEVGVIVDDGKGWAYRAVLLVALLVVLGAYAGIYARLSTGRIFLLLKGKETQINESVKAYLSDAASDGSNEEVLYRAIFDRLVDYFESDKPYLDGNLSITDVAKKLLTNRLYLSRTINKYAGRNFCQYVNYHRIRHSVKVFQEDPQLRTVDLAAMSGFNSLVSFNMAFRLYMNISPGEWCRGVRESAGIKKKYEHS